MEARIDRHFERLTPQSSSDIDQEPRQRRDQNITSDRRSPSLICYNVGRVGHMARNCRWRRQFDNRPNNAAQEEEPPTYNEDVVVNHTTRSDGINRESKNAIYIRGSINRMSQLCLIDIGSEVSLVPFTVVEGLDLRATRRCLMAANGTE